MIVSKALVSDNFYFLSFVCFSAIGEDIVIDGLYLV